MLILKSPRFMPITIHTYPITTKIHNLQKHSYSHPYSSYNHHYLCLKTWVCCTVQLYASCHPPPPTPELLIGQFPCKIVRPAIVMGAPLIYNTDMTLKKTPILYYSHVSICFSENNYPPGSFKFLKNTYSCGYRLTI